MSFSTAAHDLGWMAFIPLLLSIVGIVITIALIVAIFQIRTSTRKTADRLDDIYRLLRDKRE